MRDPGLGHGPCDLYARGEKVALAENRDSPYFQFERRLEGEPSSEFPDWPYLSVRVPRHFGNATQPQNAYTSPSGRVALLGFIGFVHLGQTGAAAANSSGKDTACRILLVELPIHTNLSIALLCRTIVPVPLGGRGDKIPVRPPPSGRIVILTCDSGVVMPTGDVASRR